MGQKVNPNGFRVGVIKDWDSRWFASKKDFADNLIEDRKIRDFIKKRLTVSGAGVSHIEIERVATKVTITIFTSKPGIVIGKGGAGIEQLKADVSKMLGRDVAKNPVHLNVIEIKNPDADAQLIAENIAGQLERRVSFRRAMKMTMGRSMRAPEVKGIKLKCSGRLGGAEIARDENYHDGSIPLQTLRADIDYGFAEAKTTYGRIGVKVWLYKGEILTKGIVPASEAAAKLAKQQRPQDDRRGRRPRNNNERGRR